MNLAWRDAFPRRYFCLSSSLSILQSARTFREITTVTAVAEIRIQVLDQHEQNDTVGMIVEEVYRRDSFSHASLDVGDTIITW